MLWAVFSHSGGLTAGFGIEAPTPQVWWNVWGTVCLIIPHVGRRGRCAVGRNSGQGKGAALAASALPARRAIPATPSRLQSKPAEGSYAIAKATRGTGCVAETERRNGGHCVKGRGCIGCYWQWPSGEFQQRAGHPPRRATLQIGYHVRSTDCATTLADLIAAGLVVTAPGTAVQ